MPDKQYSKGKRADKIVALFILFVGVILAVANATFLPVSSLSFSVPLLMLGVVMIMSPHTAVKRTPKNSDELKKSELQSGGIGLDVDETYYFVWS